MESTIVIKVKYGETLRRFNALVIENELVMGMLGLRERVIGLFNFAPDADLVLTYIDEDGDVVTLVDEDDLLDVTRQSLNPLRITVRLNTEKNSISYARSSESSTPMRSPQIKHPLQNLNTSVSEILKSVPEPFREALSKLSLDLASKATSSAPGLLGLSELVDCFSKMGLPYLRPVPEFQSGAESSTQSGVSRSAMGASVTKGPKGSKVDGATTEVLESAKSEAPTLGNSQVLPNARSKDLALGNNGMGLGNENGGAEASLLPAAGPMNLDADLPVGDFLFGSASSNPGPVAVHGNKKEVKKQVKKQGEFYMCGKSDSNVPAGIKSTECHLGQEPGGVGVSPSSLDYLVQQRNLDSHLTNMGGGMSKKFHNDIHSSSGTHLGLNHFDSCPFTGMPVANDPAVPSPRYPPRVVPFKRSYNVSDGRGSIFHRGVRCDGCGIHPITGPRFKSRVKENYDLCSICFAEMGNEADYIIMDRPVSFRHPLSFKGLYDPQHTRMRPPTLPQVLKGCGMRSSRPKLDSHFIQDVNVLDGTIMAPSTPFTKIWRMRNNGTIVWPQGTQLVWIGGDRLSDTLSVDVEISADGLSVDKELDIAVDFTAPELPGRYISYWRMASPSGQKFGQRVWVLIQVDASLKDSMFESFHGLNLNLPPVSSGIKGPGNININVDPIVEDSLLKPQVSDRATELVEPIVDEQLNKEQELNFPINDNLLVSGGVSSPIPPEASSSVSYPIIDFSEVALAVPSPAPTLATEVRASAQAVGENVEQTLLRELEEMGFGQVDLNKEILRMNEYDLEQSVDDLCGVAEWDPILEELQEMGFCDKEMNKKLLKKNNGSIKRVVMDLISGEKA